jgi:hypothetical protein
MKRLIIIWSLLKMVLFFGQLYNHSENTVSEIIEITEIDRMFKTGIRILVNSNAAFLPTIKKTLMLFIIILLVSCFNEKKESRINDNFYGTFNIVSENIQWVPSEFISHYGDMPQKEITWSLCDELDFDKYFDKISETIFVHKREVRYGSFLFTSEHDYLHIKLENEKEGWIRTRIPVSPKEKEFYLNILQKNTNPGFVTITYFKNKNYAFVKFNKIMDHNVYGYIVDLKNKKILKGIDGINLQMDFNKDAIVLIQSDPYVYDVYNYLGIQIENMAGKIEK